MPQPILVLRHAPEVPLGSVADVLTEAGLSFRYVDLFEAVPERLPLDEAAGLVVLGGAMSANDVAEYPFLEAELDWLRQAVQRRLPLLGICLGAQLLAKALGGRVYRNPVKEIGFFNVELTAAAGRDRLFLGRGPAETVFLWHGDTFDLPRGAVQLARGERCPQQAFRYGESAYGLQFHVEMTPELLEAWLREPGFEREVAELPGVDAAALRAAAARQFPAMGRFSRCLLGRFAAMVSARG
jgi:GMP synthase (glutamine-hydrolysing)